VERTEILLHFIDVSFEGPLDPEEAYRVIRKELELYDPALLGKPEELAATKIDAADPQRVEAFRRFCMKSGRTPFFISSQTGDGIPDLLSALDLLLEGKSLAGIVASRD
jgi:GTP-binding protein